jgi:hypothetical protein
MKFYGITMEGKFVNQVVGDAIVGAPFNHVNDTGRLVYNEDDGFLWWGDGNVDQWRTVGAASGDQSEMEDFFSDLLRTSMFLNCTWSEFWDAPNQDTGPNGVDFTGPSTPAVANQWDSETKSYSMTNTQILQSTEMFDPLIPGIDRVTWCMPVIYWTDEVLEGLDTYPPTIEISVDNGGSWQAISNMGVYHFTSATAGKLKIRVTATGTGILHGWGIYYNRDPSIACAGIGLSTDVFPITVTPTTGITTTYVVGSIMVFLNGVLLVDGDDYTATSGTAISFTTALQDGDTVHVMSTAS